MLRYAELEVCLKHIVANEGVEVIYILIACNVLLGVSAPAVAFGNTRPLAERVLELSEAHVEDKRRKELHLRPQVKQVAAQWRAVEYQLILHNLTNLKQALRSLRLRILDFKALVDHDKRFFVTFQIFHRIKVYAVASTNAFNTDKTARHIEPALTGDLVCHIASPYCLQWANPKHEITR